MDPFSIIGLVKFIPDLIGLFDKKRGKKAQDVIGAVGKIAESVTGKQGHSAVEALENNPDLVYKFQLAVMADEHVQDQMRLEDLKTAREMYQVNPQQANKIAEHIMRYNLILVFILVVINVISVMYLKDSAAVLAIISNFIGIALNALLNERQAVTGFYFGSSLGSKMKDGVNQAE